MTAINTTRIDLKTIIADSMCEKSYKPFLKVKNQTGVEDVHYSVVYEGFPSEFQAVAERELMETSSAREDGLRKLKDYTKKKNIPVLKDHLLLAILRNCKFDIKKSETKLKKFNSTRMEIIRQLLVLDVDTIENIIDDMTFGMLPYRDKQGRVIFYTRPYAGNWDIYSVNDVAIIYMAASLFVLNFPITAVAGISYFGECKTDSLHIFYPIFGAFRKYLLPLLSLPIRISRVEILNENYMCQCFYGFMRTVISKKLLERISLHGRNFEKFFQMYHPSILPEEFGGCTGPISNEMYREKFLDFIKDLRNQNF